MDRRAARVLLTAALLLIPRDVSGDPPGAFELLERVRRAYAVLPSYHDLGEIEVTVGEGGRGQTALTFFETSAAAGGKLTWRSHGETAEGFEERVVWSDGTESFVFSGRYRQFKPISSLAAELAHALGPGSYDALVVPLLLAGAEDVLGEPEGAAVDGPEPCGEASCWRLVTSRLGGAIESELKVDQATSLIREVEVTLEDGGSGPLTLRVRHHPGPAAPVAFEPPADARRVVEWQDEVDDEDDAETRDRGAELDLGLEEEITVALFSIVARIVDSQGQPIAGLEPENLVVHVGPTRIPVQTLDWTSSYRPPAEIPPGDLAEARALARAGELSMDATAVATAGKLLVLFVQADFHSTRLAGHLKILPDVEDLLRSLHPDDRVAVVSFDSHLKLWLDFTRDRGAAVGSLKRAIRYGEPRPRASRGPSLAEHFDFRAAADAASPERALELTAQALAPLPGGKDLLYIGWGLGRYGRGGVRMTPDYAPAVRALDSARTTVFVLDVTQADRHSLDVGLENVATHTGGTYSRTFHFASQAVRRLAQTIGGHYVLTIDRNLLASARGRLTIELKDREGRVLFKPTRFG